MEGLIFGILRYLYFLSYSLSFTSFFSILYSFPLTEFVTSGMSFYLVQSDPALRTPSYYGQFSLSLGNVSPHIFSKFNPLNTDTLFIRTLSMAPLVSVLTGFDCNQ